MYILLSQEKSGKVKDVLASVVGLRLTIFHSKFIWRIFHDNDSQISLPKLRRLFKHTRAVTPSYFFYILSFLFNIPSIPVFENRIKILSLKNYIEGE